MVQPAVHLGVVQRVNAPGQAVVDAVLNGQRLVQGVHGHQTQHRAEYLGAVELRVGTDPGLDPRCPGSALVIEAPGLQQPLLARRQGGEGV